MSKKAWQWISLAFLAIIWGSSFILMKKGMAHFSDYQVAACRIFITFIFLLPVAIYHLRHLNRSNVLPLIIVGLLGNGLPAFLFTKAQTAISSSLAGMLNSCTPLFALVIGVIFFGNRLKLINVLGVVLGLLGVVGLLCAAWVGETEDYRYGFFCLLATACYGLTVNIIKNSLQEMNAAAITSIAFLFIGPLAGAGLFSSNFTTILQEDRGAWTSLGYVLVLGIVGTGIAVLVFNYMIKHTTALFATTVTYLIPVVAVLWGILDGEGPMIWHFLSMTVILCGVYLVNKGIEEETPPS